jgi:uncharacterized protein YndB with AHSA1/START domain
MSDSETTVRRLEGMLRHEPDGPAVRFERRYRTDPDDLWSAVTDPPRLQRWFMPVDGDLRRGGRYVVDFGEQGTGGGEIQECDPPRGFVASWDFEGEPTSVLRVELRPDGDGTVLVLDHSRLPVDQAVGYSAGWHGYLDGLRSEVAGEPLPDWEQRFQAMLPTYRERWAGARSRSPSA